MIGLCLALAVLCGASDAAAARKGGGDAKDAGVPDPFGPRKGGGRGQLAVTPEVRLSSSLEGSPSLDAGYTGSTAPSAVALPTYKVHIFAAEDLGPDALRKLARPSVTLWLDTGSNMLRASTLDVLRAGGPSFVRLKAPIVEAHQRQFTTLDSGVWFDGAEAPKLPFHWVGARPIAFELTGQGDATSWAAMRNASPRFLFWERPGCVAESWSAAKSLSGTVVTVDVSGQCADATAPVKASWRGAAPSTERAPFIWLRPDASPEQVRDLLVRDSGTQLLISVGDRPAHVKAVSALLDALEGKRK